MVGFACGVFGFALGSLCIYRPADIMALPSSDSRCDGSERPTSFVRMLTNQPRNYVPSGICGQAP
jgi:hypothetical protein